MRLTWAMAAFAVVSTGFVVWAPTVTPFTLLMVPLLVGGLFLGPRTLPWFAILTMLLLVVALLNQTAYNPRIVGAAALQFLMAGIVFYAGVRRTRLGVTSAAGESMLVELRDRILDQGQTPELPPEWDVQSSLHSADGTPFAGDFALMHRSEAALQVVLVDVSGKGEEAGGRALLLSGAMGALLGSVPCEGFLSAANDYLIRQDWDEGFATAIHLCLDLDSGAFRVFTAGHPPAVQRLARQGRWSILDSEGPILGLVPLADFGCAEGLVDDDDVLLLFTDGMVEDARLDLEEGIRSLLDTVDSDFDDDWSGAADTLTRRLGSPEDDRALMVVRRHRD